MSDKVSISLTRIEADAVIAAVMSSAVLLKKYLKKNKSNDATEMLDLLEKVINKFDKKCSSSAKEEYKKACGNM